jgi:hypothetical protein
MSLKNRTGRWCQQIDRVRNSKDEITWKSQYSRRSKPCHVTRLRDTKETFDRKFSPTNLVTVDRFMRISAREISPRDSLSRNAHARYNLDGGSDWFTKILEKAEDLRSHILLP